MAEAAKKATSAKPSATKSDLAARIKARAEQPPTPAKKAAPRKRASSTGSSAATPIEAARTRKNAAAPTRTVRRPEYADTTAAEKYTERVNLKITPEMKRELLLAKLDDRISESARLRGMLELWMEGRPQPDPDNPGQTTEPGRYTKAVDLRARRYRG